MEVLSFFAVPATEFGPPRAANIQHNTYIQPVCKLQEFCLQYWRRCRAVNEPLWSWSLQIHQV